MHDRRVRAVEWRDLVPLSRLQSARQVLLPVPWLAGSLVSAHYGLWIPALACSFMLFLTGLRVVHDAYHLSLGISRGAHDLVIYGHSFVMLGSMQAVKLTHLHHHRHCMDDADVEAASALMPWWKAILVGPMFPFKNHVFALGQARPREKKLIWLELATTVALFVIGFGVIEWTALRYHLVAMAVGQCLTSFFAVWTVHHDCDRSHYIARTLRNRFKSVIAFDMFFHLEHHLYPAVPTCNLVHLSKRLDAAAPELQSKQVY